jgi:hypothetical protein
MEVGIRGWGYFREDAWPGWNVWGEQGPVVIAIKQSIKNKEK